MANHEVPLRECFKRSDGWRVALDFNSNLEGWLILTPLRHVESMTELRVEEADELGGLLRGASLALEAVTGCVKTYVMLFAEAEGFAHLHLHVVPRMADQPDELRGPKIFGYLAKTPVAEDRRDQLASLLIAAWPG